MAIPDWIFQKLKLYMNSMNKMIVLRKPKVNLNKANKLTF